MNPDSVPNRDDELDALFRAVREDAPDVARAEWAMETRLLARIREEKRVSVFAWAWKLSPFFAALAVAAGVWCYAQTGWQADPEALLSALGDGGRSAIALLTEDGS